ncbi:MAG: SDR family NAD(P)-dependent oxidoreductase [Nonomuraea sp.]|nr:SDR family NAD(P)-dependent oxidoreductase [Nonomuraea sp.]NUP79593.1 SDR family NAD(P)-dependent oxidoreductase [Nonomuraea sp.]
MTPDQTILIAGATDGLGRALAHRLAAQGATLILHGRNAAKGEALLTELRDETGNDRLTFDHAELLRGHGVTVNALHPASYMPTKIVTHLFTVQSTLDEGVTNTARRPGARSPRRRGHQSRPLPR